MPDNDKTSTRPRIDQDGNVPDPYVRWFGTDELPAAWSDPGWDEICRCVGICMCGDAGVVTPA